jgi:hypothetical protein
MLLMSGSIPLTLAVMVTGARPLAPENELASRSENGH